MAHSVLRRALPALALLAAVPACSGQPDGSRGNPPGTEASRAVDRVSGTNISGAYPAQSNGTPGNPPGTVTSRALDRAAGTNTSGAYPAQSDGTAINPPGTAVGRAVDRARRGSSTSY